MTRGGLVVDVGTAHAHAVVPTVHVGAPMLTLSTAATMISAQASQHNGYFSDPDFCEA